MEGRAGRGQRWSSGCRLAVGVGASVRVRCEWEWGVECGNKNERYVSAVPSFVLVQHCWQVGRTGRRNSLLWYVLWVHPARRSTARVSCPNGFDALSAAESPRPRFVPAEPSGSSCYVLCGRRPRPSRSLQYSETAGRAGSRQANRTHRDRQPVEARLHVVTISSQLETGDMGSRPFFLQ